MFVNFLPITNKQAKSSIMGSGSGEDVTVGVCVTLIPCVCVTVGVGVVLMGPDYPRKMSGRRIETTSSTCALPEPTNKNIPRITTTNPIESKICCFPIILPP